MKVEETKQLRHLHVHTKIGNGNWEYMLTSRDGVGGVSYLECKCKASVGTCFVF